MAELQTPQPQDVAGEYSLYDEVVEQFDKKEILMLYTIIVILLILWLLGFAGPNVFSGIPRSGNVIHTLLVIVVILVVLNLLGII